MVSRAVPHEFGDCDEAPPGQVALEDDVTIDMCQIGGVDEYIYEYDDELAEEHDYADICRMSNGALLLLALWLEREAKKRLRGDVEYLEHEHFPARGARRICEVPGAGQGGARPHREVERDGKREGLCGLVLTCR